MSKNIKLIEVNSEIGAGTRGASMGIDAIKVAAMDFGSNYFRKHKSLRIQTENKLLFERIKHDYARRIKGVYTVCERVKKAVKRTLDNGSFFPIVLSGDHSTSIGSIAGIRSAFPNKRLGVIWIDAHADIHSPYTTPSGNLHGMPIAAIVGEDNLEKQINEPDEETIEYWDNLKNLGGELPMIDYKDLVYIGVRDTEKEEDWSLVTISSTTTFPSCVANTSFLRRAQSSCLSKKREAPRETIATIMLPPSQDRARIFSDELPVLNPSFW